jgi:hypothetical protein
MPYTAVYGYLPYRQCSQYLRVQVSNGPGTYSTATIRITAVTVYGTVHSPTEDTKYYRPRRPRVPYLSLPQSLAASNSMCYCDITLDPINVGTDGTDGVGVVHICRDWEKVYDFVEKNQLRHNTTA